MLFSYKSATFFILITAILHLVSPLFGGGLTADTQFLLSAGVMYLIIAWLISRHWRWFAYIAFLVLLGGFIIALAYSFNGTTVPAWLYMLIAIADLGGIVALFGTLWRNKTVSA